MNLRDELQKIAFDMGHGKDYLRLPDVLELLDEWEKRYGSLIQVLEKYIELLSDECSDLAGIASIHGWKSHRYNQGVECRKEINRLKSLIESKTKRRMKNHYVYKIAKIRISKKSMSDLMYAAIMTKSGLTSFHGIGIYDYSRSQNTHNHVEVMVHIDPDKINDFQKLSGVNLYDNTKIQVN